MPGLWLIVPKRERIWLFPYEALVAVMLKRKLVKAEEKGVSLMGMTID